MSTDSAIEIESTQDQLDAYMREVSTQGYYSFTSFMFYLRFTKASAYKNYFSESLTQVATQLLQISPNVYLSDGKVYTKEMLLEYYPEFSIFNLKIDEMFSESQIHPGIWLESATFISYRGLAKMRKVIKKDNRKIDLQSLARLLGLAV